MITVGNSDHKNYTFQFHNVHNSVWSEEKKYIYKYIYIYIYIYFLEREREREREREKEILLKLYFKNLDIKCVEEKI